MSRFPIDHILWAVDITAPELRVRKSIAGALRALTAGEKVVIEPVHILSSIEAGVPQKIFEKESARFERPVEKKLKEWVGREKLKGLVKPSLVIWKGLYLRSNIDALMKHAKKRRADLIALTTHARKGLPRFWLGSFAETLLLHSKIPLFLVNPNSKVPKRFKTVLFPTDLSKESRKVYEKALRIAVSLKAELVLYHRREPYLAFPGLELSWLTSYEGNIDQELARSTDKKLKEWAQFGEDRGARVTIRHTERSQSSLPDAIVTYAKRLDAPFIAIAAQSGPLSTLLVGSTVRQVVRQADCPVWVLHAKTF